MGDVPSSVLEALVATARRARDIDDRDRAKLRIVLGDAIAVAALAADTPAARSARAYAAAAASGPATAFGVASRVPVEAAVLANAAQIHALLLDDAHSATMTHPGTVVIPVVLALAEERDASAAEVERAVSVGYEVMTAAAAPAAELTAARGFRNVTLFGAFGAAAAAAELLGLDDDRLAAALAIAAGSAGGTLQAFRVGSPEWRTQVGIAAQNGLTAARLAASLDPAQLPVPRDALDGAASVYTVLAGREEDWVRRMPPPARRLHEITHKAHATCGANQVPIGALTAILRAEPIAVDDVERVDIALGRAGYAYPGTEDTGPFTEEGTLLSRPLAIAATLLAGGGPLGAATLRDALADPRLDAVVARVHSRPVDESELAIPQDARVDVTLRDGTVRSAALADVDPRELAPDWPATRRRLETALPTTGTAVADVLERVPAGSARDLLATIHGDPR